jgi:hypothetical protein
MNAPTVRGMFFPPARTSDLTMLDVRCEEVDHELHPTAGGVVTVSGGLPVMTSASDAFARTARRTRRTRRTR